MPIANVTLNNTFDEWRTVTNQLISFVNDVDGGSLTQFYSNSAVLTVTENIARGGKNFITLNVSSSVLDTSTLNIATANAVNLVFSALGSTDARIVLISDDANTINAVANAAFIQANIARNHANAAFNAANVGSGLGAAFEQANTARIHANTAHATGNAGIEQANTARVHANVAFLQANTARVHANVGYFQANTAYDRANAAYDIAILASGNVTPVLTTTNAAFLQANTARDHANTAHATSNASFEQANTARVHANVGFTQANTARVHANVSFEQANNARIHANVSFEQANTARGHANVSFDQANTARIHANTAHATANAGIEQANTARVHANVAHATANAGFAQANTARDHANTAHATANAGLGQANTARIHANVAFERANSALPNTSGVSFTGNLSFPTGNVTIGEGITQGIRLHVHSWSDRANIFPEIEAMSGTQRLMFNSNTSVGAWNDLMLDRDSAIIYTRGTSDDGANLIIGPWTDSSFGYKQDGAGRHGFNTSNPRYVLDANGSANISGSMIVNNRLGIGVDPTATFDLNGTYAQNIITLTGGGAAGNTIDCSRGNYFRKDITAANTFFFANVVSSRAYAFTFEINMSGSAAITWPSSVRWPANTAPSLTVGRTHVLTFLTDDGGTIWRASSILDYNT